jgi:hypothetical protein
MTHLVDQALLHAAPAANGFLLQRKCDCGKHTTGGECEECARKKERLRRKLRIGAENDPLEREADRVADQITSGAGPYSIGRSPPSIRRRVNSGSDFEGDIPDSVTRTLTRSGEPLSASVRAEMEPRFGHDFSGVRVHRDGLAERSARDVEAKAYAVGNNIVFAAGEYMPSTQSGRHLIAHELAHVVQQGASRLGPAGKGGEGLIEHPVTHTSAPALYRQGDLGDLGDFEKDLGDLLNSAGDVKKQLEDMAKDELKGLSAKPGTGALFSKSGCPKNFCEPFKSVSAAKKDLLWAAPLILAGIATKVNPKVVPLWAVYMAGGTAPLNLSSTFGADFTASPTTASTSTFLVKALMKDAVRNHKSLLGKAKSVTVDFTPRLAKPLKAINTDKDPNAMDFNGISDIAGNIAGGIGTDQLTHKIGAKPSPFNDDRKASVSALIEDTPTAIKITPNIDFSIHDTIDLCPGNCGAPTEQVATIPLSRFEATGLVGDVPFEIQFPAPSVPLTPVLIPKAPAKAAPKKAAPKKGPPKSGGKKAPAPGKKQEGPSKSAKPAKTTALDLSDDIQMAGGPDATDEFETEELLAVGDTEFVEETDEEELS